MFRRAILISLLAIAALGTTGTPVAAKSGDVISTGQCSAASTWKLKLSPEDGRIEVEFEVDQNRNNRLWRVSIARNGSTAWQGTRYTRAPSGSFSVNRLLPNGSGADRIVVRATNAQTGEVCRRSATASF
jgi:hypothetical protein